MSKKPLAMTLLLLLAGSFFFCGPGVQTGDIVRKFKRSEVGRGFLTDHPEKDLETVLAFIRDPVRNFQRVQRVTDVCSYIFAYANYLAETKQEDEAGYLKFYRAHFQVATKENVPVLTYLLLNCHNAFLIESVTGHYAALFKDSPHVLVQDLKRRTDWRKVVDAIGYGELPTFKEGLAKLPDSGFELELKNYVLSVYH